ncbi:beta-lactamase-like protein, partial [Chaetomium tenue]
GTDPYIVGSSSKRLISDTGEGFPAWGDRISTALTQGNWNSTFSHILLTHWHGHHTGGVPALLTRYPALSSTIHTHTPNKTQQPITHNQAFAAEGATLRAVHAPGYMQNHSCFLCWKKKTPC